METLPNTMHAALQGNLPYADLLDVDLFMGISAPDWASFTEQPFVGIGVDAALQHTVEGSVWDRHNSSPLPATAQLPDTQSRTNSSLGLWQGSPVHLLNSQVQAQHVNQRLRDVYTYMMNGIAVRYLDYHSNLFAGSYKYSIQCEQSAISSTAAELHPVAQLIKPPSWKNGNYQIVSASPLQSATPESLTGQINTVTMIGVARFLDNFGPMYGNRMGQQARSEIERTLIAVLQAFALQHLPSDQPEGMLAQLSENLTTTNQGSTAGDPSATTTQLFMTAWFKAHSQLVSTRHIRSFVRLYSIFLFQMTSRPNVANSTGHYDAGPLELLNDGLIQMQELQDMVGEYCKSFADHSIYRFLLHSSSGILHWFGYLRDTIDSVTHDRPCVLADAPLKSPGVFLGFLVSLILIYTTGSLLSGHSAPDWQQQQPASFDQEVTQNCQNAAGDLFCVYRSVIRLRQNLSVEIDVADSRAIRTAVAMAFAVFEEFIATYEAWFQQCLLSFFMLSEQSKLASGELSTSQFPWFKRANQALL
jgi:hypothetical protein